MRNHSPEILFPQIVELLLNYLNVLIAIISVTMVASSDEILKTESTVSTNIF